MIDSNAWNVDSNTGQAELTLDFSQGVTRVVIMGCEVEEGHNYTAAIAGMKIPLFQFEAIIIGYYDLEEQHSGKLQILTDSPLRYLAYWSFRGGRSPACNSVLPVSLTREFIPTPTPKLVPQRIFELISEGRLATAFEEIANAHLRGSEENLQASINEVLQYLAIHPLYRPSSLGALVSTLGINYCFLYGIDNSRP